MQIFSLKTRVLSALLVAVTYLGLLWFYKTNELGTLVEFNFTVSWYLAAGIGGMYALFAAFKYGFSNSIGKFLIFAGLGLLSSLIGTLIWDYNIFILGTDTPYPSVADFSYILTTPLIAIAIIFLLRAYSVRIKKTAVLFGILLAVVLLAVFFIIQGQALFNQFEEFGVAFFNVLYNINDAITLPIALVAILLVGGKLSKGLSVFLFGFLLQSLGNITFTFRNLHEIYYFGDYSDLLFVLSSAVMSVGIIIIANQMYSKYDNLSR